MRWEPLSENNKNKPSSSHHFLLSSLFSPAVSSCCWSQCLHFSFAKYIYFDTTGKLFMAFFVISVCISSTVNRKGVNLLSFLCLRAECGKWVHFNWAYLLQQFCRGKYRTGRREELAWLWAELIYCSSGWTVLHCLPLPHMSAMQQVSFAALPPCIAGFLGLLHLSHMFPVVYVLFNIRQQFYMRQFHLLH